MRAHQVFAAMSPERAVALIIESRRAWRRMPASAAPPALLIGNA